MVSDQVRLQVYLEAVSIARPGLRTQLGNTLIFIGYRAEVPLRKRERHALHLMELLEALPDGFSGDVDLPASLGWTSDIRFVRIRRGNFVGPAFQVDAVTSLGNPVVDRLEQKCQKAYSGSAPIELLAFFELQPTAVEMWHGEVARFVSGNLAESPFRRVWVYDANTKSVLFESALRQT